jgi:hypothetical protein
MTSIGSVALRLRVMLAQPELNRDLAAGLDPRADPALSLRASQLLRPKRRRSLASALERLVAEADRGQRGFTAAVPIYRDQVEMARGTLLSLADALRNAEEVHPQGVAMAWELVSDPYSPLYVRTAAGALHLRAEDARHRLLND